MKIIQITTWLILITTFGFGQNVVRDRLNAKRVNTRVVLNFTGDFKTPRYTIDEKDYRIEDYGWNHEFNKRTTFAINDETANLQLRFLNPLRYRVEISSKEIDDPLATATDTLISSIKELAGLITPKSDFQKFFISSETKTKIANTAFQKVKTSILSTANTDTTDAKANLTKMVNEMVEGVEKKTNISKNELIAYCLANSYSLLNPLQMSKVVGITADKILQLNKFNKVKSSMLFEWVMWVQKEDSCFKAEGKANLLDKIFDNEESIYDKGKTFEENIKKNFNEILKQNKVSDFKKAINDAKNNIPALDKEIRGYIESLKVLDDDSYYKDCSSTFDRYSEARMSSYINYSKRIYNKRLSVLKGFGDLCDELLKYVKDADEERNTVLVESLKTTEKKINQVTLSVQKIEWEEYKGTISWNFKVKSSNEISKATFNVVPYASVITEFGVGVLYFFSPIEFPQYGIVTNKDGKNVVAQTGTNTLNYLPAPTVTFLPRWGSGDVFWQFQVGASLANNQPVFHVGGGLRLFSINNAFVSSISVMSGVAFNFAKSLNTLSIGDEATIDKLNSDLQTKLQGPAHPYLGVQFNF